MPGDFPEDYVPQKGPDDPQKCVHETTLISLGSLLQARADGYRGGHRDELF